MALFTGVNSNGQFPNPISPESTNLFQLGTNSSGSTTTSENTDSITAGAANVKYYAMPDTSSSVNPGFNPTTNLFANISTSFTWQKASGIGADITNIAAINLHQNYVGVNFAATTGSINLEVKETKGSCEGTWVIIPIKVISAPTATFNPTTNAGDQCVTPGTTNGSLNYRPVIKIDVTTAVTGNQQLRVDYTLTGGTASDHSATGRVVSGSGTAATFTLSQPINYFGNYTLTITNISDRISRKSNVVKTGANSFKIYLFPSPSAAPVYHITNQ